MTDKLKLLPREATREMLEAMDECSMEGYDERLYAGHAGSVYMAAWDAFHGQHCYCGDITSLGVIHRNDGPCHYPEHTSEYKRGYADAMSWKVQNHLEHLQPKVRTGDCLLTGICASEGRKIRPKEPEQEPVETLAYKADYWKRMHDEVRAELIKALNAQPAVPQGHEQEPVAQWLEDAFREGWAACRDAEFVGEDEENWKFGNSTANSRMLDLQQSHPPVPAAQPKDPEQEPAFYTTAEGHQPVSPRGKDDFYCVPLYTTPPQRKPLNENEQYRMQIAGICTASVGYWKEGDSVHPDYDTPALRDVARLYAKFDELYRANHVLIEALEKIVGYDLPDENAIVEVAKGALEAAHGIKE